MTTNSSRKRKRQLARAIQHRWKKLRHHCIRKDELYHLKGKMVMFVSFILFKSYVG